MYTLILMTCNQIFSQERHIKNEVGVEVRIESTQVMTNHKTSTMPTLLTIQVILPAYHPSRHSPP